MVKGETSRKAGNQEFQLVPWTENTGEAELKSAFRKKWDWVISPSSGNAIWHAMILSNLALKHSIPEVSNIDTLLQMLAAGVKKTGYERLKLITGASAEELSKATRIPARTIARRDVFKPDESERILRVASAFQRTLEVFEDVEKARRWFLNPKRALGNKTPLQFCDTELGADEVTNLLGRIEHGVFS